MSIKERLLRYCKERHTTIGTFCRHAGISSSYFNNVKGDIGKEIQIRIANTYEDLNVEWLRTGEGQMLNTPVQPAVMTPFPSGTAGDVTGSYSTSRRQGIEDAEIVGEHSPAQRCGDARPLSIDECNELCPARLPYVKGEIVQSRNIDIRQLIESEPQKLEYRTMRQMIGNPDYVQKVITGAMMPLFQPGDLLFIQFLPEDAKLISGAIYLIDTKLYGAMVRQVYLEEDVYVLHSLNPDFHELRLKKSDIYSKALVLRSMRSDFNIPKPIPDVAATYRRREEQLERLLSMHEESLSEIRRQNERMAEERRRQDEERKAQFEQMIAERNRQDKLIEKIMNL